MICFRSVYLGFHIKTKETHDIYSTILSTICCQYCIRKLYIVYITTLNDHVFMGTECTDYCGGCHQHP